MVKRGLLVFMLALGFAGCGDDGPTTPADANVVVFRAQLSAANEVPPITNAEANARGDVEITMRIQRDGSNTITGATFDFVVNLNSFPAGSTWTLAHIHEGPPGVAGGVRVNTGLTPANPVALTNGGISNHRFSNVQFGAAQNADFARHINEMMVNPNGYYFNVHTALNATGAVRGQLVKQ